MAIGSVHFTTIGHGCYVHSFTTRGHGYWFIHFTWIPLRNYQHWRPQGPQCPSVLLLFVVINFLSCGLLFSLAWPMFRQIFASQRPFGLSPFKYYFSSCITDGVWVQCHEEEYKHIVLGCEYKLEYTFFSMSTSTNWHLCEVQFEKNMKSFSQVWLDVDLTKSYLWVQGFNATYLL